LNHNWKKQEKISRKRKKFVTRLSGCCSSESAHLALWAVKLIPLFQYNMQLCCPPTRLHGLLPRTLQ